MFHWILLFTSVILGICGQLFMKKGMTIVGTISLSSILDVFKAFFNPFVFSGFVFYGISAVLWLVVISKLPLSKAYPILSSGYIIVVFASYFLFKEDITLPKIIGVLLIATGVILIGRA